MDLYLLIVKTTPPKPPVYWVYMKRTFQPLISVIIPAYNEEKYIGKCLDALQSQQTSVPFEIIVINNNSTDRTVDIAKSYPITLLQEKTKGSSASRNTGVKYAKADIIVCVDADCIVEADHIDKIALFFRKNPQVDVLAGPYVLYDAGFLLKWLTDWLNYYWWYFKIIKTVFGVQAFASGNFAIRKSAYLSVGGFDPKIDHTLLAEDVDLAVRLNKSGHKVFYDRDLKVQSSNRRFQKSPLKPALIRSFYIHSYLLKKS